jgi:hypothetical protein
MERCLREKTRQWRFDPSGQDGETVTATLVLELGGGK